MQQHSVKFEGESQASSKFPTTQQQPVFGKTFSFKPYFEIKAASSATQSQINPESKKCPKANEEQHSLESMTANNDSMKCKEHL